MAVVTMYSPTGNPEVINVLNVEKKLEEGYHTQEAWLKQQKIIQEQKYQEWLNDPATVQERFQMLRQACENKLAQTDYAMTIDYPIAEESKSTLWAYRKAIRELNHQAGAPWDGGGPLTPWPVMPTITKLNSNN